jgi:hypothetical protein
VREIERERGRGREREERKKKENNEMKKVSFWENKNINYDLN